MLTSEILTPRWACVNNITGKIECTYYYYDSAVEWAAFLDTLKSELMLLEHCHVRWLE